MAIQQMTLSDVEMVSGGGNVVVDAAIGWLVGKILDAGTNFLGSLNQGGTPGYTDALGNVAYGFAGFGARDPEAPRPTVGS